MDRFYKFMVLALVCLSLSLGWQAFAIPAPSINSICEPGGCGSDACTFMFYVDGSTYLAKNCKTGANDFSGTNPTTVFNSALSSGGGGRYHFRGGPYVFTSQLVVSTAGVTITCDSKQGTILRLDPTFPSATSLLLVNADRFTIRDCEFDGNNVALSQGLQSGTVSGPHAFNSFWNFNAEDLLFVNFKSNAGALNIQGYYYVWIKTVELTANFNAIFLGNLAFWHLIADYVHDNTAAGLNDQTGDGEILGGTYYNNTNEGMIIGANAAPFIQDITVDGISSSRNGDNGLKIGYAGIIVSNSWIFDNGWKTLDTNVQRAGVQLLSSQNCNILHTTMRGIAVGTQTWGAVEQNGFANTANNYFISDSVGGNSISPLSLIAASDLVFSTLSFNPQNPRSVIAGASVWTYTDNDNAYEQIQLTTVNGLTSWTCRGITMSNTVLTYSPVLSPTLTCLVTWATTAPVFEVYPQ